MNGVINPSRVHNKGCAASAASPRKVTFYCCVAPQLAASHPGLLPALHDPVEESEGWTGLASLTSRLPHGGLTWVSPAKSRRTFQAEEGDREIPCVWAMGRIDVEWGDAPPLLL